MIELVILLMAIATFAFVVFPLFTHIAEPVRAAGNERLQELQSRKNTAYSMLKEVDFDHHAGLLSDDDRQELEASYRKKALSLLASIDSQTSLSGEMEAEIERSVQGLRQGKSKMVGVTMGDDIERQVRTLRKGTTKVSAGDEVERQIRALREKNSGRFCPQCGAATRNEDHFCRMCGKKLD